MKKIALLAVILIVHQLQAQQQSGRVVYELTRQMQLRMAGMDGGEQVIPRTRTEKIEVLFANNSSLRRQLEDDMPDEFASSGGANVNIRMIGGGADDIAWYNFTEGRGVQQREFATKQYLIIDSIRKLNWKLTGESKTILGYTCQQALTTRTSKRFEMSVDNGKMNRKEIPDTSQIVAWFTTAIPVPAGPEFQGQLPGLILQIETNGAITYKAIEISPKVDEKAIREPKKGKKVTNEEFNQEREKAIEEMHKNGPPGRRVMRVN